MKAWYKYIDTYVLFIFDETYKLPLGNYQKITPSHTKTSKNVLYYQAVGAHVLIQAL